MLELLLQGKIELPSKCEFLERFCPTTVEMVEELMKNLFHIYLMQGPKGSTSTIHWANKVHEADGSFKDFNRMLRVLSKNGWIEVITSTQYHWSEVRIQETKLLEYLLDEELLALRLNAKSRKYQPRFMKVTGTADMVRQNGKTRATGLIRKGFAAAAETQFYYDSIKLEENKEAVIANVTKGMRKCRELHNSMLVTETDYDMVATDIVETIVEKPTIINIGDSVSDSRGRAIKKALSTVANPIGYKDFRALITIPKQ